MVRLNNFLNVMMGAFFGNFAGNTIANYKEYVQLPEIYAMRPAPWFCYGALQSLILFVAVTVICVVIKKIISVKMKRNASAVTEEKTATDRKE